MGELKAQNGVTRLSESVQHCGAGARTRVGLDVGIGGTKKLFRPLNGEVFGNIDKFAAAVVALSGIPLGVLVGQNAALGFEDGVGNKVLAGDHLEGATLAPQFFVKNVLDLGVNFCETLAHGVHGFLPCRHDEGLSTRPRRTASTHSLRSPMVIHLRASCVPPA